MNTTSQRLKCSNCHRSTSFAKDSKLETTGVCSTCTQRQSTADPVTVYRNTMDCGEHEITLYSDGQRAYAHGAETDATVSHRDREHVWVTCGQPLHNDEPCEISIGFDLTEIGTWTTDPDAIRWVTKYGQAVE